MEPLRSTAELLKEWEDIINAVDKTNFPIQFVNSVSFESRFDEEYKVIDIKSLRKEGYDDMSIQEIITETLLEFPESNGEMEFSLDIAGIAKKAQAETNKILRKLQ